MTFVTFACVFNMKSTDSSITVALISRFTVVNIYVIFLPLELKFVSCGFNSEGCVCSSGY